MTSCIISKRGQLVATEANIIGRFELFLLGEGEKKIEEKVYSGEAALFMFCRVVPQPNDMSAKACPIPRILS